ncbi:MAG: PD40 domain-containing protein [Bacteroidales bacterium]|nr:PD40 domain-containing protein [Bacteroidales bacterium]
MNKLIAILIFLTIWINVSGQQNDTTTIEANYKGEYLGLNLPDTVPEIFAPDFISGKGRLHCFPSFSIDNKEIYWMTIPPKIMTVREINGKWSDPQLASFSTENRNFAPFVAHDNTIYFSSNRDGGKGKLDIWHTTKIDSSFTVPLNIGDKINTGNSESNPTVSENKTMFYAGSVKGKLYSRGIYYSTYENGEYQIPVFLPEPINIMDTAILDYTPFIAPDESYLLFCSNRQNPEKELCHIYISFKKENGEWNEPIDLSLKMGFTRSSKFPYITPDKKFLFFSCGNDMYWVDAKIIDIKNE